jgi:hypothetical protein
MVEQSFATRRAVTRGDGGDHPATVIGKTACKVFQMALVGMWKSVSLSKAIDL